MSLTRLTNTASAGDGDPAPVTVTEAPFLADSDAEDWERLERHSTRRRFSSGEEIVSEGEIDRSLIIVLSGELAFVRGGRELHVLSAPLLVGEVGFFDPGPRSGTLVARTDGELLQLGFEQFETLAAASPSLARTILLDAGRVVAMRLRRATDAAPE